MHNHYPQGFYLQHDKLSSHVAAENWILEQGLRLLDFPTYSPDLTPIEHLWGLLKQAVATDGSMDEEELISSLYRNWEILTQEENLQNLIDSTREIYQECLDLDGIRLDH